MEDRVAIINSRDAQGLTFLMCRGIFIYTSLDLPYATEIEETGFM